MSIRRRDFHLAIGLTVAGVAEAARGTSIRDAAGSKNGLSLTSGAIHQEIGFGVPPAEVYETLLDAARFDAVTKLGEAFKTGKLGNKPTAIAREVGGPFTIFGGYIDGQQVELVPAKRIVQVWREEIWPVGIYSIVRFDLSAIASGTRISLAHTGFPDGAGPHLATGWYGNYWNPLKDYLAQRAAK
jgi:activator of HSP90 ATPase